MASAKMVKRLSGAKCNADINELVVTLLKEQRNSLAGGKVNDDRELLIKYEDEIVKLATSSHSPADTTKQRIRVKELCGALIYRMNLKRLLNSNVKLLTASKEGKGSKRKTVADGGPSQPTRKGSKK